MLLRWAPRMRWRAKLHADSTAGWAIWAMDCLGTLLIASGAVATDMIAGFSCSIAASQGSPLWNDVDRSNNRQREQVFDVRRPPDGPVGSHENAQDCDH